MKNQEITKEKLQNKQKFRREIFEKWKKILEKDLINKTFTIKVFSLTYQSPQIVFLIN